MVGGVPIVPLSKDHLKKHVRNMVTESEVYIANSHSQYRCKYGAAKCTVVWYNDHPFHAGDAAYGIYLIVFMVALLILGSYLFVALSRRLVVAPIERMFKVAPPAAASPETLLGAKSITSSPLSMSVLVFRVCV